MFAKITTLLFILFFLVYGIQSYGQDTIRTQSPVETTKVDTNQALSAKEQKHLELSVKYLKANLAEH